MKNKTLDTFTDKEFRTFINEATREEIKAEAPNFTLKQITSAVSLLGSENTPNNLNKLYSIVSAITDNAHLEAIGKELTNVQMQALLAIFADSKQPCNDKLSPILIGLSKDVFAFVVRQAKPEHLSVLQQAGPTEPMQHQLTILAHALNANLADFGKEFGILSEIIEKMDINDLTFDDIVTMTKRMEILRVAYQLVNHLTECGLSISWHTDRGDLIEKFNTLRSICTKNLQEVGFRGDGATIRPTGLFSDFGARIMSIYGDADDPHDTEALQNDDPAIEALAKFSIWYLEDFFEVGLLPEIKSPAELDLDPKTHNEAERAAYRNNLIQKARQNLEDMGLKKVGDLKENAIFSKRTLSEHIKRTQKKQ